MLRHRAFQLMRPNPGFRHAETAPRPIFWRVGPRDVGVNVLSD